jgi:hypothetical protein
MQSAAQANHNTTPDRDWSRNAPTGQTDEKTDKGIARRSTNATANRMAFS